MSLLEYFKAQAKAAVLLGLRAVCVPVKAGQVIVLCYHSVPNRDRFAAQMMALAKRGYPVLSMQEFCAWASGAKSLQAPGVLLTFDDGYLSQFENALPVLQLFGFPAVFFPVTGYLGKRSSWEHEFPDGADLQLMDEKHLIQLRDAGYTVGCHTHAHPHLTRLSSDQVRQEVDGSKWLLEDLLGQRVTVFCYPYGDYNRGVAAVVKDAGFDTAFTVDRATVTAGADLYRIQRLPVLGEPDQAEFDAYLNGTILLYWKLRR